MGTGRRRIIIRPELTIIVVITADNVVVRTIGESSASPLIPAASVGGGRTEGHDGGGGGEVLQGMGGALLQH